MLDYQLGDRLPVLNHGYVALIDKMGSDAAIVDAARVSYDGNGKSRDRHLIRYLLRHKHTSPFEMAVLKFEVKMPIFVARQWIRHRTASINEVSARYTQLPSEMFVPEVFAVQSTDNKQGRDNNSLVKGDACRVAVEGAHHRAYDLYETMLEEGVAREIARGVLPLNIYTKFVWQMNLHNLMHFMHLRLDPHAQEEIRDYAERIEKIVNLYFPITHEAFVDYVRDSYTCSRMEVRVIQDLIRHVPLNVFSQIVDDAVDSGMSDREIKEFEEKFYVG